MMAQSTARPLLEERRRMMGTTVSLHLAMEVAELAAAQAALRAAWGWLAEVEARLSRFDPQSELSALHRAMRAGPGEAEPSPLRMAGKGVPVARTYGFVASPMLFDCLACALDAAEQTNGLFDPALLPNLRAAGYDQDFAAIKHRDLGPPPPIVPATGRWREIRLDPDQRTIAMPPDVQIDLGGIAKGWAADHVIDQIFASFPNALVNVGGDMRLRGGPGPGVLWAVAIDRPTVADEDNDDHLAIITPGEGGVATSGANRRWWRQGNHVSHHLIDPRTGLPARLWTPPAAALDAHAAGNLIAAATALAPHGGGR